MATPSQELITSAKKAAGEKAVEFIRDGMHVGLGTGSTSFYFIEALIKKCREGLKIKALATSERSHDQALKGGIAMLDEGAITTLDIDVDGADEIDFRKRMIKGGGGALLREKIIANMSKEVIIVVDESKYVPLLGKFPLPVEITPFGAAATIQALVNYGYHGSLRLVNNMRYRTDSQNFIYDITFDTHIDNPEYHEALIKNVPGVVTTGFFFHLAHKMIVGYYDGNLEIIE